MDEIPDPEGLLEVPPPEKSPADPSLRHDPYAPLRLREYNLYLFGNLAIAIGSNMQSVAVGWELYERTHSSMSLAWVGLVQALPIMLLALPSGQLADRLDRRRIVLVGVLVMVLASLGLAYTSHMNGPVGWMYTMLLLGAIGRAFFWPASQALMPQLVPDELFSRAVTWRSTGYQLASVLGPALGGFMIGLQHTTVWVYLVDACMGLVNCGCVAFLTARPATPGKARSRLARNRIGGISLRPQNQTHSRRHHPGPFRRAARRRNRVAADLCQRYFTSRTHWTRLAPRRARRRRLLHGAHAITARPPLDRARRCLLLAVTIFRNRDAIVFGVSTSFWLSLAMLAVCGAADNISVVVRHVLVQMRTPDDMRGRVSAVNSVFISASNELGEFESGTVARFSRPAWRQSSAAGSGRLSWCW